MKTKAKTKFLSLLLALFMLLASITTLGVAVTAHADGGIPVAPDFDSFVNDNYTSLYYISDYEKSEEYFDSGFVREKINIFNQKKNGENYESDSENNLNAHLYYFEPNGFWDNFSSYWNNGELQVNDAFIIFEVRYSIPKLILALPDEPAEEEVTSKFTLMYDKFSAWKESGCKIMFICGTSEARFCSGSRETNYQYCDFLQFVDIHIDVDTYTINHYSAIKRMEMMNGGAWGETTIVLDVSMGDTWSFYKSLIEYFVFTYTLSFTSDVGVLEEMGVTVYFYYPHADAYWDTFCDPSGDEIKKNEFESIWPSIGFGFIVSGKLYPVNEYSETIWSMRDSDKTGLYLLNYDWDITDWFIANALETFMLKDTDELKRPYNNNVNGCCEVTYIPLKITPNGWLMIPEYEPWLDIIWRLYEFEDKIDVDAFQKFMNSPAPSFAQWRGQNETKTH